MARTALTPVPIGTSGVVVPDNATAVDFANGNSFPWRKGRQVLVTNGDSTTLTVTVPTPGTVGSQGLAIADATFTVAAGKTRLLPPLGQEFRNGNGSVYLDYSGADASVTAVVVDPL